MNTLRKWAPAIIAGMSMTSTAYAADYKLQFLGSEAVALQSAAQPRPAGYMGVAPPPGAVAVPAVPVAPAVPGNLAAGCSTCVPGGNASKHHGAGVPNQIVTFLHPYTQKAVTVPLTLPVGKPTLVIRSNKIIYNYGLFGYKVVVKFLPNGLVEVKYDD